MTAESNSIYGELLNAAEEAVYRSYCPYTKKPAGAALLTGDGELFTGSLIENASFPCAVCAEMAAFAGAVSRGKRSFTAIAVSPPRFPCGKCRQVIREFANELDIVVAGPDGKPQVYSFQETLPDSFGPDNVLDRSV